MADSVGPTKSPDGRWWWDGTAWQPIATLAAVAPPAQDPAPASPATGQSEGDWPAWLPRTSYSESVLGSPLVHEEGKPAPRPPVATDPGPQPPPVRSRPRIRFDPRWLPKDPRILILGGAALVAVIGIGLTIGALVNATRPTPKPKATTTAAVQTSPSGTQLQQAQSFLSKSLDPAVAKAVRTQQPIDTNCGSYSASCRDSLFASNLELQNVISVINRGPVPNCIADPARKLQADTQTMDDGIQQALTGFRGNNQDTIAAGLRSLAAAAPAFKRDADVLDAAAKTACAG